MNLDSLQSIEGDDDRASAAQAVIEGQAVYDQLVAMAGNRNFMAMIPGGWDADAPADPARIRTRCRQFANAPMVLQETLIFPYLSGAEFMRDFDVHEPGKQPYGDMPTSTEQILHPGAVVLRPSRTQPIAGDAAAAARRGVAGPLRRTTWVNSRLGSSCSSTSTTSRPSIRGAAGGVAIGTRWSTRPTGGAGAGVGDGVGLRNQRGAIPRSAAPDRVASATVRTPRGRSRRRRSRSMAIRSVIYVDAPPGSDTRLVDAAKVTVK